MSDHASKGTKDPKISGTNYIDSQCDKAKGKSGIILHSNANKRNMVCLDKILVAVVTKRD